MLRIATWNVHDARGADGKRDLDRVAKVIAQLDAPLIGLQEVACGPGDSCDVAQLALANGYRWHAIPTRGHADLQHGNALLSLLPVEDVRIHDLSVPGREPRGALEARVVWGRNRLRVVVTHLGLRAGERRRQVERLLSTITDDDVAATVLLGDINEWWLWGRPLRWLHRRFGASPSVRTFPARAPLFALDRIWVHPREALATVARVTTWGARHASDHLPLVATLRLPTDEI
ncbi:MAG: endonuclease/exonuclease/phosphatase family protein [Deltaproteobacteria bacterium]|nr:endonuclease/exonuclease/phosphatase family protein [Deltaproteobacteria bacterium]